MSADLSGLAGPPATPDASSAEFFGAAARETLLITECAGCGHLSGPAARGCGHCGSGELTGRAASGEAVLVSWAVLHQPPHPAFAGQVPLTAGIAELAEGPWLEARVVAPPDALRAGLPLTVAFWHREGSASMPVFMPRPD